MSIINEALKKTQSYLQAKVQVPASNQEPSQAQAKEKNTWLWSAVLIVAIGFFGCLAALFYIASGKSQSTQFSKSTNLQLQTTPAETQANPAVSKTLNPPQPPIAANSSDKELILNGIIEMDGDQFALINNQIYKPGDSLGDKRLLSISTDKVEIYDRGKIITLKTQSH